MPASTSPIPSTKQQTPKLKSTTEESLFSEDTTTQPRSTGEQTTTVVTRQKPATSTVKLTAQEEQTMVATRQPQPATTTVKPTPRRVKTQKPKRKLRKVCQGRGRYRGYQYDIWCKQNCNHNVPYCPRSVCLCRYV